MSEPQPSAANQYVLAEYHEAANAYFKGVDIGYTAVKSYITANGLFAALLGALSDPKGPLPSTLTELVRIVPWFALVISFALFVALPHYFRHLNNCSMRCAELEHQFEGKLFTRLNGISSSKTSFNSGLGLLLIIGTIASFWLYFALKMNFPDLPIWATIKTLIGR